MFSGCCCNGGVGGTLNDFGSITKLAGLLILFINHQHGGSYPGNKQAPGCVQHSGGGYHTAAADSSGGDSGKML